MKYLTKKRVIALVVIIGISILLLGWNNSTTPTLLQKVTFNEENAKQESRKVLDDFFKVSANNTFIANENDMNQIRMFVNNKCKGYFTNDFMNDTTNELSTQGYGISDTTFYLSNQLGKVKFYNNYQIYSPTIDKEKEILTYHIETTDIGIAPTISIYIQMKIENGKWKINKVSEGDIIGN